MIRFLASIFINNPTCYESLQVRHAYGMLCSTVGILLNLLLFAGKWAAGFLSGSIAITADAFNNLSDAGSSLITLAGFVLSSQKADSQHPFGHGRMEYIAGLFVSVAILIMGFELIRSSFNKVLHPSPVSGGPLVLAILAVSVLVKLYMFYYNRTMGKKLDSSAMKATAMDSLSDMASTLLVLLATIVGQFTDLALDGWLGILVGAFIFYTGVKTMKDTIDPLLGQPPTEELVERIRQIVLSHSIVYGMHDLIVHDYGPGRRMISLHAEVPADGDLVRTHEQIDHIEQELQYTLNCAATIHMDPIVTDDVEVLKTRDRIAAIAASLDPGFTIHDFRMIKGQHHIKVIFDVVLPYSCPLTDVDVVRELKKRIYDLPDENYLAMIRVDRDLVHAQSKY